MKPVTIHTIGHSTHSIEVFIEMLQAHGIRVLADVRRFPASRKFPHFNGDNLASALRSHAIEYSPFPDLGGRRPARPDSPNTAWRNSSFRGYADFMECAEFVAGVERLMKIAADKPTAMMCSEAVWWRCHRGLIADFLKVRGWEVLHIVSNSKSQLHPYTSAARLVNGVLTYAPAEAQLKLL